MEKRKELNLGYSNFKNIIENNNYFVDKSLLIKEVIQAEKAVLLLPRPRRFGKTLNLSMFRHLEIVKKGLCKALKSNEIQRFHDIFGHLLNTQITNILIIKYMKL